MLTRQGRVTVVVAIALFVAGRLFGSIELYVFGAVLACLVAVTVVGVALTRIRIDVSRELRPPRVHAGTPSRVDVRVENRGAGRSPLLSLHDAVSGTRGARLLVGPLGSGESARAAYRLPTERRGILTIGPLDIELSDPFGMARLTMTASGASELTVYPRIDELDPLPMTTGNDPLAGAEHPNSLGRGGEDFYALRDYVVGDDLRRVHWPSTARHDDLMVRQDELPWQGRATVLVDVRSSTNTPESLELVISAAASIVATSGRRQDLVRLVSTDGADSGFAAGHAHVEAIMEHLASVEATNEAAFQRVLDRLARGAPGGALVVVVALVSQPELERLARLRPRFGSLTIVQFDRSTWDPLAVPAPVVPRKGVMPITSAASFAATWNRSARPTRQSSSGWKAPARVSASVPGSSGTAEAGDAVGVDDWDRWARFRP
jgi:uncharacterized protein (DUF58 family)